MDPIETARQRLIEITVAIPTQGDPQFVSDSGGGYWTHLTPDGIEIGVGVAATQEGYPHCGLSCWDERLPTGGGGYMEVNDLGDVDTWESVKAMLPTALAQVRAEIAKDLAPRVTDTQEQTAPPMGRDDSTTPARRTPPMKATFPTPNWSTLQLVGTHPSGRAILTVEINDPLKAPPSRITHEHRFLGSLVIEFPTIDEARIECGRGYLLGFDDYGRSEIEYLIKAAVIADYADDVTDEDVPGLVAGIRERYAIGIKPTLSKD